MPNSKEMYLVCWMENDPKDENTKHDYYRPFIEQENSGLSTLAQASSYYLELLDREEVYSANLCKILKSTDYFEPEEESSKPLVLTDKGKHEKEMFDKAGDTYPTLDEAIKLGWYVQ